MVKVLVVVSDCHSFITHDMEKEARAFLESRGVTVFSCHVPGALEIPAAIGFSIVGDKTNYDGYLAIGCVLKGGTDHYEHVSREVMRGIMDISIQHLVPVANGVITVQTLNDALQRACRNSEANVARKAAEAILQMIDIYKTFI